METDSDINLSALSEREAIGIEIYKLHRSRHLTGTYMIEYKIIGFTIPHPSAVGIGMGFNILGYGSPTDMDKTERSVARDKPGVLLRRLDNHSKAQPAGSVDWRIRSFLQPDRLREKRFRVRRTIEHA